MKQIKTLVLLLFFTTSFHLYAQESTTEKDKIVWMDFETVYKLYTTTPKPILIDLYTDWCHWCKVMDEKTYKDPRIIAYITEKYYTVKFNAESKSEVDFFGKKFQFGTYGNAHDLAYYLTGGQLAFPTTIVLPANQNKASTFPGYLNVKEMEKLIKFFGTDSNLNLSYEEFGKDFKNEWE